MKRQDSQETDVCENAHGEGIHLLLPEFAFFMHLFGQGFLLPHIGRRDHINPGKSILDIFVITMLLGNGFEVRPIPRMPWFHEICAAVSTGFEAISQINLNSKNIQDRFATNYMISPIV